MHLKNPKIIELDHRAGFLSGNPGGTGGVAASPEGEISIWDWNTDVLGGMKSPYKGIRGICIHPSKELAVVSDGASPEFAVVGFYGDVIFRDSAPSIQGSLWQKPGFDACCFDPSGEYLYCAAPLSDEKFEIQLRATRDWTIVDRIQLDDPFEDSRPSLHPTGRDSITALWLDASQNGQQLFWLRQRLGRFKRRPVDGIKHTTAPVFSPNGQEFLVLDEQEAILKFQFSRIRRTGVCRERLNEEDSLEGPLCYVNERHALVATHHCRVLHLDVESMTIRGEVMIAGHEPRRVEAYYPTLAGDKAICTDIDSFQRIGEFIVFVCGRDRGPDPEQWQDRLLCFPIEQILSAMESSSCPA